MSRKNPVTISSSDDDTLSSNDFFSGDSDSDSYDEYVSAPHVRTKAQAYKSNDFQTARKTRSQAVPSWFSEISGSTRSQNERTSRPYQSSYTFKTNVEENKEQHKSQKTKSKSRPYSFNFAQSDSTSSFDAYNDTSNAEKKQKSKTPFSQKPQHTQTPQNPPKPQTHTKSWFYEKFQQKPGKVGSDGRRENNPDDNFGQNKRKHSEVPPSAVPSQKRAKKSPTPPPIPKPKPKPCPKEADYNLTCGELFAEWEWNALYKDIKHYRRYGVWPENVSENDVKKRLRKLQLRTHPDKQIYQTNPLYPYQHCSDFKNHCFNALDANSNSS
jgi:hypothetical protein